MVLWRHRRQLRSLRNAPNMCACVRKIDFGTKVEAIRLFCVRYIIQNLYSLCFFIRFWTSCNWNARINAYWASSVAYTHNNNVNRLQISVTYCYRTASARKANDQKYKIKDNDILFVSWTLLNSVDPAFDMFINLITFNLITWLRFWYHENWKNPLQNYLKYTILKI